MTRLFLALVFFSGSTLAQTFDHSHQAWDNLLKKHVVLIAGGRASQVRYTGMAQDRPVLKAYLASLTGVKEGEFASWNKPQRMAFLINAYNAFTVELILENYPVKSIKDIGGVFDDRWKRKFFSLFGRPASLDQIEHEMLRKPGAYDEPRAHFALNCASVGCPMLREAAYVAERLEGQLEEQTERFLSDRSRNRYARGRLEVSKIFDWYKEDFAPRERFFARYAKLLADDPAAQKLVAEGKARFSFLDYDWTLNDFPSSSLR
ncbi:MAG TPA: DUF547 domain-containing protein [Burkholderiales bacterium]|nr:DUF547 domain-containing protein [Burkholderiales bacterium]